MSVFVWTAKDVVGAAVLCVIVLGLLTAGGVELYCRVRDGRRKKGRR